MINKAPLSHHRDRGALLFKSGSVPQYTPAAAAPRRPAPAGAGLLPSIPSCYPCCPPHSCSTVVSSALAMRIAVSTFGSRSPPSISEIVVFPTPTRRASSRWLSPKYSLLSLIRSFIPRPSYHIFGPLSQKWPEIRPLSVQFFSRFPKKRIDFRARRPYAGSMLRN